QTQLFSICHFVSFTPEFRRRMDLVRGLRKPAIPVRLNPFLSNETPIENATTIRVLDALHFESACQASF
ncbi:MAG: hypothetical protein ACLUYK_10960, partial [Eggerthella lenta]